MSRFPCKIIQSRINQFKDRFGRMAFNQISNHWTLYCQSKVRSSIPHAFAFACLEGIQLFSQGIIQHSLVHEITSLELQHQKRHCQIWVGKSASRERQHVIEKSKGRRRLEIWTDLAANLKRVKCRMTVQDIYESFFFFFFFFWGGGGGGMTFSSYWTFYDMARFFFLVQSSIWNQNVRPFGREGFTACGYIQFLQG